MRLSVLFESTGTSIFVDLDETILHTTDVPKARPCADEFLKTLRSMCDSLCALTAGGKTFQSAVLRELGLLEYFDEVYGEPLNYIPHYDKFILIDNLGPSNARIKYKMNLLGVEDNLQSHLVNVRSWDGGDDDELMKIIPEVQSKLGGSNG